MKQILLIFLFFAINPSFAQEKTFEGMIKYRTVTTSYVDHGDTIESMTDTTYSNIYHKNGNYVVVELQSNEKQVFLRKSCKIYVLPADGSEVQVFPGAMREKILEFDSVVDKKELLGYTCKGTRLKTASIVYTSYFSPIHFMNTLGLKNCNFWDLEFLADKIPLYSVLEEAGSYKLEMKALEITSGPVDDYLFELPKNTPYDFVED